MRLYSDIYLLLFRVEMIVFPLSIDASFLQF